MDRGVMELTMQAETMLTDDDLVAGLPQAPLAMPKQVLQRQSDGVMALVQRLILRTTRAGG